ncbi:MAG: hypothetical protein CM1200mP3_01750 [Chloroflexota bacterium]|nr:MAG: hypothetical protein CM1200mP3_01750 [Chloroflexota bacterium]
MGNPNPINLISPWGIEIWDPINQSILIADWRNNLVKRFSTDGELLRVIGNPRKRCREMKKAKPRCCRPARGYLRCRWGKNNRVLIYNHRGMFMESLFGEGNPCPKKGVWRYKGGNPDAFPPQG